MGAGVGTVEERESGGAMAPATKRRRALSEQSRFHNTFPTPFFFRGTFSYSSTMLRARHHRASSAAAAPAGRARGTIVRSPQASSSSDDPSQARDSTTTIIPKASKRALLLAGSMAGLGSVGSSGRARAAAEVASSASAASPVVRAAAAATTTTTTTTTEPETYEFDDKMGLKRLRYSPKGYRTWLWTPPPDVLRSSSADSASPPVLRVNWLSAGPVGGPPILLVHGYGASAYHYRYNIPALAEKGFRVFACDLVGFGWSERSTDLVYGQGRAWARQLAAFVEQVVRPEYASSAAPQIKVAIAGNSLGGMASLAATAARPDLFRAVALLNSAGQFEEVAASPSGNGGDAEAQAAAAARAAARARAEQIALADGDVFAALDARRAELQRAADQDAEQRPLSAAASRAAASLSRAAKRAALFFAFQRARQPEQIRSVLRMVYASEQPLDDDLVASIVAPTADPRSAEVFALVQGIGSGASSAATVPPPPLTVDASVLRLARFGVPMALVWGERDPWITPSRARQILALAPQGTRYYGLAEAGHCPHDDSPRETNEALAEFFAVEF